MPIHIITRSSFQVGDFTALPMEGVIEGGAGSSRLEPVAMNVLLALVKRAGEVVTRDEVITAVWKNQEVSDDSLTRCVSELRAAFGDDPKNPQYIETIPKRGYRLVAAIGRGGKGHLPGKLPQPGSFWVARIHTGRVALALLVAMLAAGVWSGWAGIFQSLDERKIAVMPLLDFRLNPDNDQAAMNIAQALREVLSSQGQWRVVPRRTSAVVADDAMSIRQIALALDARWIVEGSLRSGQDGLILGLNLIDGRDEYNIHATRYTLDMGDEEAARRSMESFAAQLAVTIEKASSR